MGKGIQAIERAVDKANTSKGFGRRFSYFGLEDGESVIVRFLTDVDDIITTDFYEFVHDNQGGKQRFIVAPTLFEDDPSWQGEDWVLKYGGKTMEWGSSELTSPKPKERTVAIAVEREEIPVENPNGGRPKMRYQDKLIKVETKDGATFDGRNYILVIQPAKTFWAQLVGYYGEFGTLCDREYKISRKGTKLATVYTITPKGEDPEWTADSLKELQEHYGYGKTYGEDDPDRFLFCPQTLDEWAREQASEDRAKFWLGNVRDAAAQRHAEASNASGESNGADEFKKDTTWNPGPDDEAQAAPASAAGDVSALRARLERHK